MRFVAGLAQIASVSGDPQANLETHLAMIDSARAAGVDLLLFPELSLSGADLTAGMPTVARSVRSPELKALAAQSGDMDIVVGFAEDAGNGHYHNTLLYLAEGEPVHAHRKVYLVSADPFNERRYFAEGQAVRAFPTRFGPVAMINCEDAWHLGPAYLAMLDGAQILITGAATPFGPPTQLPSPELWLIINRAYAILLELFNLFVNRVGSEGVIDFCGGSHAVGPRGEVLAQATERDEGLTTVEIDTDAVLRQRYEVSYVRDERVALTLRELQRVVTKPEHPV
jgi:predicted amidohydrolase